jgi:hypothetical protein
VLEMVSSQDQLMDLAGAPARHLSAAMEQNFHQSNHASVVDLNAGNFALATDNRQSQALEQREVDRHVEGLSLESTEALSNLTEDLTHCGEIIESFLQMKVNQIVAAHFASEESEKLLVLLDKGVPEVGSQDVMAVLNSFRGRVHFALKLSADALTKELRDLSAVKRNSPNSQER